MYKALRIGAISLIPLVKASLADMHASGLMILNICSAPSDAAFNKQPTPSHVGLLTRKKCAYHRDSEKFPSQSLQFLMAN